MDERELIRRWVDTWKRAGPELEAIWRREVCETDNAQAIAALESAFNHATRTFPSQSCSGLVEMQRIFQKLRR